MQKADVVGVTEAEQWRWVPVEPTDAMFRVGWDVMFELGETYIDAYREMVLTVSKDARPAPSGDAAAEVANLQGKLAASEAEQCKMADTILRWQADSNDKVEAAETRATASERRVEEAVEAVQRHVTIAGAFARRVEELQEAAQAVVGEAAWQNARAPSGAGDLGISRTALEALAAALSPAIAGTSTDGGTDG